VDRFRWVQCQIEELGTLRTDKAIRQALKSLPRDLDETYERTLSRINPNDAVMAKRALTWLAYASRPLVLDELAEAAVLEHGTKEYDPEARLRDPEDILEICGSLIWHRDTTDEVVLAHHSVKDFLRSQSALAKVEFYHLQDISSNAEVAKSCLTYLLLKDFAEGPARNGQELLERYIHYPLLDFAARHWCAHAVFALFGDKELHSLAMKLMDPKCTPNFMAWIQELLADPSFGDFMCQWNEYPRNATPLYFAASFGLIEVVKSLLEAGVDLNDHGGSYRGTALHAAAWRDHPKIVRLLLEAGADQTAKDVHMRTAYDLVEGTGNANIKWLFDGSNSLLSAGDENTEYQSNALGLGNEKTQIGILKTDIDEQNKTQEELSYSNSLSQKPRTYPSKVWTCCCCGEYVFLNFGDLCLNCSHHRCTFCANSRVSLK